MTRLRSFLPFAAALGVLTFVACSGSSAVAPSGGDGTGSASNDPPGAASSSSGSATASSSGGTSGGSSSGGSASSSSGGSSSSSSSSGGGSSSGNPPGSGDVLPDAVGWIIQQIDGQDPWPVCPATLITPTHVATHRSCIGTSFDGPGGQVASGTLSFARAGDAYTPTSWIPITKATTYQNAALAVLGSAASGVTPIALAGGPLTAADVGNTFLTARVAGREVDGTVPSGTKLTLHSGNTTLKSVAGQAMHAVFPTFADFVNAYEDSADAAQDIADGPNSTNGYARIWQRPLLGAYEVLASGDNEQAIGGGGVDTVGAPLLRKVGAGYELVGIYKEPVEASDKTKTPYVVASYYVGFPSDTLAFLGGASKPDNACGDVKPNTGECRNGFALNCDPQFPTIDLASDDSAWCGLASKCKVTPNANGPGSYSSCQ